LQTNHYSSCIYCSRELSPNRGQGDHVIPAALGEFIGGPRFHGICRDCNSKLGRAEQHLLSRGAESFFRRLVHPASKRTAKRSLSAPGGRYLAENDGYYEEVDPDPKDPTKVVPHDTLCVECSNGEKKTVRLYAGMTIEQLRAKLEYIGALEMMSAYLSVCDRNWDSMKRLCEAIWPGCRIEVQGARPEGFSKQVKGRMIFEFNELYFRAIAKIAFHYYLVTNRRGYLGDEDLFGPLIAYIKAGGKTSDFVNRNDRPKFVANIPPNTFPSQWLHLICVVEEEQYISVSVTLFWGPGSQGISHSVRLGKIAPFIAVPVPCWATAYQYDVSVNACKRAGWCVPVQVCRVR